MQPDLRFDLEQGHVVHFYAHDAELVSLAAPYLGDALASVGGVVVVATPDHVRLLFEGMAQEGVDVGRAVADGQLVVVDAGTLAEKLVVGGRLDPRAFETELAAKLRTLSSRRTGLRVYGELVSLLWDAGQVTATLELEDLWNGLRREISFGLLCGYPSRVIDETEGAGVLAQVCSAHAQLFGAAPVDPDAEATERFAWSVPAIGSARRFVADTLSSWGMEHATADATLVVSELATNAVLHGRSEFSVGLSGRGPELKIAVGDAGAAGAVFRSSSTTSADGRGLALVEAISLGWGQDRHPIGKVVWATVEGRRPSA